MPPSSPVLLWFRRDLRVDDHPALRFAVESGQPVLPVVVRETDPTLPWQPGGASRWWWHHALERLERDLAAKGLRLVYRSGPTAADVLSALATETGASTIVWNRRYDPPGGETDRQVKALLEGQGTQVNICAGDVLFRPQDLATSSGGPYRVFTPFYRACLARAVPDPVPMPRGPYRAPAVFPASETLSSWQFLPRIPWDAGFVDEWQPTHISPRRRLADFLEQKAAAYPQQRDLPAEDATSRLSPSLCFGQLSPRTVWQQAQETLAADGNVSGIEGFLRQILWREFAIHLLYHQPQLDREPLQEKFRHFPWRRDNKLLRAWQRGETGYPLVDAGMRQLWATGWMHNRVRMVVGSFLVKHLLQPWQEGAAWFWDTLVDADLANNSFGWQWIAGCGADAAPYFRIFNPILQSRKFDPDGAYIRRWVPELREVPDEEIHTPWLYGHAKEPIIDHAVGRQRALDALAETETDAEASATLPGQTQGR